MEVFLLQVLAVHDTQRKFAHTMCFPPINDPLEKLFVNVWKVFVSSNCSLKMFCLIFYSNETKQSCTNKKIILSRLKPNNIVELKIFEILN